VNQETLKQIVEELSLALTSGVLGKIFQLSAASFAIDFRRREGGYLFLSADPASPRVYLIARPVRELEKHSKTLDEFGQALRINLTGGRVTNVTQDESERVVRFTFERQEETGEITERVLVAQLTGRSANLFLLDDQGNITHAQRSLTGPGQMVGEQYSPPRVHRNDSNSAPSFARGEFQSLSAATDHYYLGLESTRAFDERAVAARARLRQEISRLQKLQKHLSNDLSAHGEAEQHKRIGDLLLANIANAERSGNIVKLQDYYSADVPTVEIEIDENATLQAEAAKYFARYSKARRAAEQISKRLGEIDSKLSALEVQQATLEKVTADRDDIALTQLAAELNPEKKRLAAPKSKREPDKIPGVRRYLSSDAFEVLVGRASKDNDHLTFRVGKPQDLWLHAADYPGSHVIVRNPTRKEVPHRTIIEAAQLAARFSQANNDAKVNVNYTPQKFVSRIRGAAPGLVRLASFRTITVEPKEGIERI
jgi:predicted ribosome quality control (RQC) complex YloA/Tae2 family protein